MIYLLIPLIGLFVSLVSVFIGLGGGILLVPLLPEVSSLSTHEAVATSLLTIVFVVGENTYRFHKQNLVSWTVVKYMGPISALTAIAAAQVALGVDPQWILKALLVILILVAVKTLFSSLLNKEYKVRGSLDTRLRGLLGLGGAFAGLTSGFAGVGSGVILSPVMIMVRAVSPVQLVPTANANMFCTTLAASLSYVWSGHYIKWNQWGMLRWDIALGVFLSASFFSQYLRPHQNKLPFRAKSLILALLLISLIIKIYSRLN